MDDSDGVVVDEDVDDSEAAGLEDGVDVRVQVLLLVISGRPADWIHEVSSFRGYVVGNDDVMGGAMSGS